MGTILIIAFFQMSQQTLSPAIDTIAKLFPEQGLKGVQEAFAIISIVASIVGILSAVLINNGLMTKRGAMIGGLFVLGATGPVAALLHTEFWHLQLLGVMIGTAMGLYIVNTGSVLFDSFTNEERQPIVGYQTSCISGGGIFWSLAGGVLCSVIWYGGYLMLTLALPLAFLAWRTVPKTPRVVRAKNSGERVKMNPMIYYYCAILGIFMGLYVVGGSNISTHLAQAGSTQSALAGAVAAVQMAGGAVCGIFFGRLSKKLGDLIIVAAMLALIIGFVLLGLFPNSLVITFIAMFISGMSLSCTAPRVMFAVSSLSNERTSATSSAIANSVAPSLGSFLSPYIFTRTTLNLFGEATSARYLFVAGVAAVFGIIIAVLTLNRRRRGFTDMGEKIA